MLVDILHWTHELPFYMQLQNDAGREVECSGQDELQDAPTLLPLSGAGGGAAVGGGIGAGASDAAMAASARSASDA